MSKKTKKQKIIAAQRRQGFFPKTQEPEIKKENLPLEKPSQNISIYPYPVRLIRHDLTKTFLLVILAISLEIALYFILEQKLVLPFKISY